MKPCILKNIRWDKKVLKGEVITEDGNVYYNVPIRSGLPLVDFSPEPKAVYEGLYYAGEDGSVFAVIVFPIIDTHGDILPGEARFRSFMGDEIVLGNKFIQFLSGPLSLEMDASNGVVALKTKDLRANTKQGDIEASDDEILIRVIEDNKSRKEAAHIRLKRGRNPNIDFNVNNISKVNLNRSQIDLQSGAARIRVKKDRNIEIENSQTKIIVHPNGDVEIGDVPKIKLDRASGKIEIHAGPAGIVLKGPSVIQGKILTSQTTFCPILGPLTPFGDPSLKTQQG